MFVLKLNNQILLHYANNKFNLLLEWLYNVKFVFKEIMLFIGPKWFFEVKHQFVYLTMKYFNIVTLIHNILFVKSQEIKTY